MSAEQFHSMLCHLMLCVYRLINLPHAKLYMITGCTIWMYAKLFYAKLYYLMFCCITCSNTTCMPFHVKTTRLTSQWTVSLDSVPFHVRCLAVPSHPVSIFIMSIKAIMCNYKGMNNCMPAPVTLRDQFWYPSYEPHVMHRCTHRRKPFLVGDVMYKMTTNKLR